MKNGSVSVVIPCYNHAHYLARCIQSVFDQSYLDVEIILIDDGSSDQCLRIARELKRHSPFEMSIIAQNNRGAHATINRGIAISNGQYINVLNSDDYFHPDRLASCIETLNSASSELVFARVAYINQFDDDMSANDEYACDLRVKQDAIRDYPTVGYSLLESNVAISTGNFFFSKVLFNEIGPFDDLKYCHDWDFILRALLHTEPVYIDKDLYFYRLHQSNSFRGLDDVAGYECPYLMRKFFAGGRDRAVPNRLAPTARNWGEYFWTFIESINYEPYLHSSNSKAAL